MDFGGAGDILDHRVRRFDMRNEVDVLRVTSLGKMDLKANPDTVGEVSYDLNRAKRDVRVWALGTWSNQSASR